MKTIKKMAEMLRKCYNVISDINADPGDYIHAKVKLYDLLCLLQALHEETELGISPDEIIRAEHEMMPEKYCTKLHEFIENLEASA